MEKMKKILLLLIVSFLTIINLSNSEQKKYYVWHKTPNGYNILNLSANGVWAHLNQHPEDYCHGRACPPNQN